MGGMIAQEIVSSDLIGPGYWTASVFASCHTRFHTALEAPKHRADHFSSQKLYARILDYL